MIVDLAGVTLRDLFDRLVLLFQLSHVTFERGFEFALSPAKLGDRFSDRLAQLRQFLGTEQDKGDQENDDQLLHTQGTHGMNNLLTHHSKSGLAPPSFATMNPMFIARYLSLVLALPLAAQVRFTPGKIDIDVDGKPFTTLHSGADAGKPYLAPLRSASGKIVTRRYPMEKVEGESRDHVHHRGLWFSYDDVNGIKFWENEPTNKRPNIGQIVMRKAAWKDGDKSGTLETVFDWNDPAGNPLLVENRLMTFYSNPTLRIIDFDITLNAPVKVVFGDTKEGAFAIRLADALTEKTGSGKLVNAEGKSGMKDVWGKRSKWADYSGTLDGEQLGVAIFDHPSNPCYPVCWHARDYGLFALNPWGQHAFDASKEESHVTVPAGGSLHFRWRVVIHPGDTASAHIADLYRDFAK